MQETDNSGVNMWRKLRTEKGLKSSWKKNKKKNLIRATFQPPSEMP